MNSLLSPAQRAIIRADTMIDVLIIQRVVDGFDCLLRDDLQGYVDHVGTAILMVGQDAPKPSAVDVVKTICIRAYADQNKMSFKQAHARLQQMINEA